MADSDTETQAFDSQSPSLSSPSSLLSIDITRTILCKFSSGSKSGNRRKDRIADEHQNTVPFHDTVELESPSAEIQMKNSDAETEVMDVPDCVENRRTETVDAYEKLVVPDSDDEEMHRIEETNVMELSSSGSKRRVGRDALNMEKRKLTPSCENGSVASAGKQCYAVYIRRGVGSVYAHSVSVSGFATHCVTDNSSSNGPNSIQVHTHYEKRPVVKDNDTSRVEDQLTVDANIKGVQNHDICKCNGKINSFKDENKNGAMVDGEMVSSCNREATDGGKDAPLLSLDQERARLSYIESQESGESSRVNALDFVDHYLSSNDVNLFEEVALKSSKREKSPPVLSAKGPQLLARRANLGAVVGKSRTFEWDDSYINDKEGLSLGEKKELILDYEGRGSRSVTVPPSAGNNMDVKKQENVDVQCKEMGSINSDSRLMLRDSKEISEAVQTSEIDPEKDFVRDLNEQFDAESSGRQLEIGGTEMDIPDTFDVGFNTQLAAEAMEALLYAPIPSPNCNADYAHQKPDITLKLSSNGATKRKAANCCSFPKICSDSGVTARKSRTKRSANKSNGNISSLIQEHAKNLKVSDPELTVARKMKKGKLLTENHLNCRKPANARKSLRGRSKSIHQGKKEGALVSDNIKVVGKNISSSISVEDNLLGKGSSRGKFRKFSPIFHRTRDWSSVKSLERIEHPINSAGERTNNVLKVGVPMKGRKRASLNADVFQVLGVRKECPRLGCNTSVGATNGKVSQQRRTEIDVDVAVTASHLKLDSWSYPKGKRKSRNPPDQSSGAISLCAESVSGEKSNYHSIESSKNSERNSKTTCFSLETLVVKKKARSSVYTRHQCSLEKKCGESILRQNFDESNTADVMNCDYAPMNNEKIPRGPDRAKTSLQSGELDDVNSISFADGVKKNILLNENDNRSLSYCPNPVTEVLDEASPIFKGDEDYKQPSKKKFSRLPLLKELTRLGIESLPNFASKDLRRRRNMANVRVLFSQNLDDDIIKQQKKILARLGISTASCCSDATHFITDRFVRTKNMLEAIAFGRPVVTHLWLESCGQASCLIDEKNYILRDAKKEKEIGFSMPISLARASHHPLLKGRRVFITPNVKPGKELIGCLVKAVHGQVCSSANVFESRDCEMTLDDLLILSCEQDYAMCVPFLEKGAAVYSSELLLNGIVIQKLEFERCLKTFHIPICFARTEAGKNLTSPLHRSCQEEMLLTYTRGKMVSVSPCSKMQIVFLFVAAFPVG
ncbi:uncharacterized protein LOC132268546 [Cornus florida]|uniref:uncharacterized protein LOC132268546 n=1 Tax=Cornus florida TaxID=4283 RepID=UPI0028A0F4F2|nr:uncharacterized protein LOC132268546 [Cornus florida]